MHSGFNIIISLLKYEHVSSTSLTTSRHSIFIGRFVFSFCLIFFFFFFFSFPQLCFFFFSSNIWFCFSFSVYVCMYVCKNNDDLSSVYRACETNGKYIHTYIYIYAITIIDIYLYIKFVSHHCVVVYLYHLVCVAHLFIKE